MLRDAKGEKIEKATCPSEGCGSRNEKTRTNGAFGTRCHHGLAGCLAGHPASPIAITDADAAQDAGARRRLARAGSRRNHRDRDCDGASGVPCEAACQAMVAPSPK